MHNFLEMLVARNQLVSIVNPGSVQLLSGLTVTNATDHCTPTIKTVKMYLRPGAIDNDANDGGRTPHVTLFAATYLAHGIFPYLDPQFTGVDAVGIQLFPFPEMFKHFQKHGSGRVGSGGFIVQQELPNTNLRETLLTMCRDKQFHTPEFREFAVQGFLKTLRYLIGISDVCYFDPIHRLKINSFREWTGSAAQEIEILRQTLNKY